MRFGTDEGEGGTFALFHGIFPPKVVDYEEERTLTTEYGRTNSSSLSSVKTLLDRFKWVLLTWVSIFWLLSLDSLSDPSFSSTESFWNSTYFRGRHADASCFRYLSCWWYSSDYAPSHQWHLLHLYRIPCSVVPRTTFWNHAYLSYLFARLVINNSVCSCHNRAFLCIRMWWGWNG